MPRSDWTSDMGIGFTLKIQDFWNVKSYRLVNIYHSTGRNIAEVSSLRQHRYKNSELGSFYFIYCIGNGSFIREDKAIGGRTCPPTSILRPSYKCVQQYHHPYPFSCLGTFLTSETTISSFWIAWLLKMGSICSPETSVLHYKSMLRNIPEPRNPEISSYFTFKFFLYFSSSLAYNFNTSRWRPQLPAEIYCRECDEQKKVRLFVVLY